MKCPVCLSELKAKEAVCPVCGFDDIRYEFINDEELRMWKSYVVYPCKFAYQTAVAQRKKLERKFQNELSAIKKDQKEAQETESGSSDEVPVFKTPAFHKSEGWNTSGIIAYKNFTECAWPDGTRCEISNVILDVVGNAVTVNFHAKKVFDKSGPKSRSYIGFRWKLKDDYGILVNDGLWGNDRLNVGDITKGTFQIRGLDTSIKYVLEFVDA